MKDFDITNNIGTAGEELVRKLYRGWENNFLFNIKPSLVKAGLIKENRKEIQDYCDFTFSKYDPYTDDTEWEFVEVKTICPKQKITIYNGIKFITEFRFPMTEKKKRNYLRLSHEITDLILKDLIPPNTKARLALVCNTTSAIYSCDMDVLKDSMIDNGIVSIENRYGHFDKLELSKSDSKYLHGICLEGKSEEKRLDAERSGQGRLLP